MTIRKENNEGNKKPIHDQFNFQADAIGSLGIPEDQIPDGMDYLWVVESVNDKHDHAPIVKAMRKGWTAVPPDRHPNMVPWIGLGGAYKDMDRTAIRIGGLILMERPKNLGVQERRAEHERYNHTIKQAHELNKGFNDDNFQMRSFINDDGHESY
jgi:hypothetical protein